MFAHCLGRITVVDVVERYTTERDSWFNRLGDKWVFKFATLPFAISSELQHYGRQFSKRQIHKLPIVVDFDRFNSKIDGDTLLMGYVGTSAAKDGLDTVLKGFALALEQNSKLRLRIIGPKPKYFDYDAVFDQLGLDANVELTGSVSYNEVPQKLLECDTFIMNRTNSEFAKYGYPTKLGEYFACKRPVLMSDGPGFSEDYTDRVEAIKYEVDNPKALADAIIWRYENPQEANTIAQRGYDYAKKHFSSEVVGAQFRDTIQAYLNY